LRLTDDEQRMLNGEQGEVQRKLMQTLVRYGETMDAGCLVEVEGPGHLVVLDSRRGWGARLEFLEEVAAAGLKTRFPFTMDPPGPYRVDVLDLSPSQEQAVNKRYAGEERYRELMLKLGLRDRQGTTCTPWFEQVGNRPQYGQILAWAESSAVVFINSVLGARTHRNAGVIELISNLVGKTPLAGLLTDDGRKADWLIEVDVSTRPDPQLLGFIVGDAVLDEVPYVTGMQPYLSSSLDQTTLQYLHDFGTNCAVGGGVGLFHIDGVTPEARQSGQSLLRDYYKTLRIDDDMIAARQSVMIASLPTEKITPDKCLVGCPHLTLTQLLAWSQRIDDSLSKHHSSRLAVETIMVAAPEVVAAFEASGEPYQHFIDAGARLSSFCLEGLMQDRAISPATVITNSNKLRHYNTGVYYFDDELLAEAMVTGVATRSTSP